MKIRNKISQIAAGAALAGSALIVTAPAQATCVADPYIASVCMTAANFCPRDYVEASGGFIAISQNPTLYALIGTTYGGDGITTMGIPDLRGRSAVQWGQGIGLMPISQGHIRGRDSTVLYMSQMPSHSHTMSGMKTPATTVATGVPALSTGGNEMNPASNLALAGGGRNGTQNMYTSDATDTTIKGPSVTIPEMTVGGTLGNTGGSNPVELHPPQLGMRFCMAVQGLFPPRN